MIYVKGTPKQIGKFFKRTELTTLPKNSKVKGWFVEKCEGVTIVNTYIFLPWYKKLFTRTFWSRLYHIFDKCDKAVKI